MGIGDRQDLDCQRWSHCWGAGKVFLARPAGVHDICEGITRRSPPPSPRRPPATFWQPFGLRAAGSRVAGLASVPPEWECALPAAASALGRRFVLQCQG
jgi:hypothetical protein